MTAASQPAKLSPVIDIHTHLVPPSLVRSADAGTAWFGSIVERGRDGSVYLTSDGKQTKLGSTTSHYDDLDSRIKSMDALGVDIQVLSLLPSLTRYKTDRDIGVPAARAINDELSEIVAGWPDRFLGLATLPLQDPEASIRELGRAVNQLGFVGVQIGSHVAGANLDDPALFRVFQACAEQRAFVLVHPIAPRDGTPSKPYYLGNLVGNPWETTMAIASLVFGGVIQRLPELHVGFVHAGGSAPYLVGRFDHGFRVRKEPRAHTSMSPRDHLRQLYFDSLAHDTRALRYLVDTVGLAQVVFGSDYPADMSPVDPVGELRNAPELDPREKDDILGANLTRLLERLGHRVPVVRRAP